MAYINQEELFAATDGGLNVILWKYPNAQAAVDKPGTKFKVRDQEKTASAALKKMQDGTYLVTDFGGDQKPRNAIQIVMFEDNVDFKTAINIIADKFNVSAEVRKNTLIKADFIKRDATAEEEEGKYYFDVKDSFSENDLKVLFADNVIEHVLFEAKQNNKGVLPEDPYKALREICKRFHLFSLNNFIQVKNRQAIVTASNEHYPIFMVDAGDWKKIYQPNNPEKQYRFRYVGERPKNYIFGLQQCVNAYNKLQETDDRMDAPEEERDEKDKKVKKLEDIILCSGDRDALNVAAMGYHVVWLNSESAKLDQGQYISIARLCDSFYNLPDIDTTGVRQAHELAMQHLDMKTIWLPAELKDRRDFRGNPCKDIRDYLRFHKRKAFQELVRVALPYRFWDVVPQYDKSGKYIGQQYTCSNTRVYNFLAKNGFAQLKTQNEEQDIYVKVTGNVVKEVKEKDIRKYINEFLDERKMDIKLRDTFYRSRQITGTSFENLPYRTIDFSDFDKNSQYMFFKNKVWKIVADKIEEHRHGEVEKYVWEQEVIPHRVELLPEFFSVTYDQVNDDYNIDIKNTDCLLFKFMINSCRMFWKVEEFGVEEIGPDDKKYLRKELTEEEKKEQHMHLINRIYTLGYLLHRYKDQSRPWAPWALENKVSEESVSEGGTGKSIFMKIPKHFMKSIILGARDQEVTKNKHLLENVNEHTDFVLLDDCNEYLNFPYFYPMITGEWTINPKNTRSFVLDYKDAPKMGFSSNYYPRNIDPSTERRLLYTVFSDYYHSATEEHPEQRSPKDEFKKNLFEDFNETEWNLAINLVAQCLKVYLNFEKINPPMSNVTKRKLMTEMGETFKQWADVYFSPESNNLDYDLIREEIQEECLKKNNLGKWSSQRFTKALKAWCKMKGYTFNPKEMRNADGRIIKKIGDHTKEVLYIRTKEPAHVLPGVMGVRTTATTERMEF